MLPLIPESARIPSTAAVCSRSIPAAFAVELAYFIASPSWWTSVFVLEVMVAKTSAALPAWSADIVKPDIVSLTISAASPRSIPAALARDRSPGVASMISLTSQPASAR